MYELYVKVAWLQNENLPLYKNEYNDTLVSLPEPDPGALDLLVSLPEPDPGSLDLLVSLPELVPMTCCFPYLSLTMVPLTSWRPLRLTSCTVGKYSCSPLVICVHRLQLRLKSFLPRIIIVLAKMRWHSKDLFSQNKTANQCWSII